jgi:hypothetical protein
LAQVFISESSRRNCQIPEDEMQKRWDAAFGPRQPVVCEGCGEVAGKLRNGLCAACRPYEVRIKCRNVEKYHGE